VAFSYLAACLSVTRAYMTLGTMQIFSANRGPAIEQTERERKSDILIYETKLRR
jgi:hypothetical protein